MPATRTRAVICVAMLLTCGSRASALNSALDINQYAHAAWTIRDGFVDASVNSIVQTPDGYLWLGTDSGLLRFDGVRTVRWQPRPGERLPSTNIQRLLVSRDGQLWIATAAGLASLKEGRLAVYPELAGQNVLMLLEDHAGVVWAGTLGIPTARLCEVGRVVRCFGHDGRFGRAVLSALEENGSLWLGTANGLWRWTDGEGQRYDTPPESVLDLITVDQGQLLIAMTSGVKQFVRQQVDAYPLPGVDRRINAYRMLRDRDGGLWIATFDHGIAHMHSGRTDRFMRSDGLSSNGVRALFEDREGNIWAATTEGIDRFRDPAVTTISDAQGLPSGLTTSILPTRDGSVWVGSVGGAVRFKDGATTIYRTQDGLVDDRVQTLFQSSSGTLLAATLPGIATFDNDRFTPIPSLSTRVVYNIVEGRTGSFWINDQENGLINLVGQNVVERILWSSLGHQDHATALVADHKRDGLWIGFYNGGVAFLKDGAIRTSYGTADGLGEGRVAELQLGRDGELWAATAGGLSRIQDNRISTLTSRNGLPCDAIHWTIEDADLALWLMMPCGLARIDHNQLAAWIADPGRPIESVVFDSSDGVRTQPGPIGYSPPAARLPDGRLFYATPNGIGVLDPRHLPTNALTPPVHIEQIIADRKTYETALNANVSVRLPPRVHDVEIDYTALSLAAPQQLRFRYQLEGVDREWREVGSRRQAFYTDLPPRAYRFRVTAANSSGVWNETGATVDFAIAPAYYQTTWFLALSLGGVVAAVWAAHRVRLRIVEKHQREITALNERLMKAQEQERIRIAGELHDGVMQQMVAVTMMLGTTKRRLADTAEARATIDKVQEKLIKIGTDIRQLSHDLHPPVLQEAGLPQAVRAYCEEFSSTCGIPVSCDADDDARDLSRGAALALFRILQEALGNAAKHSAAKRITVRLKRSKTVVSLEVSDDGVGFERHRLGTSRGLGLITMRERAGQLDGTFDFDSAPGRGTRVSVAIPFR